MSHKGRKKFMQDSAPGVAPTGGMAVTGPRFPPDITTIICQRVMAGTPLHKICEESEMPAYSTVSRWLNTDPGFMKMYLDAARVSVLMDADRMQAIADGEVYEEEFLTVNAEGETVTETIKKVEPVDVRRLRIQTIQWRATKLLPKIFGDKVEIETGLGDSLDKLLQEISNNGHSLPTAPK